MRPVGLIFLLVAVPVLGACGGGDDDDSASSKTTTTPSSSVEAQPEPVDDFECPLLATEVELNLGIDVDGPGISLGTGPPPTANSCVFPFGDGSGELIIRVFAGTGDEVHQDFLAAFADAEELEILGRTAAWSEELSALDVVDGDDAIQVQILPVDGTVIADPKRAAIDLAGVVLAGR